MYVTISLSIISKDLNISITTWEVTDPYNHHSILILSTVPHD